MKKILSLFMAFLIILSILVGCSGGGNDKSEQEQTSDISDNLNDSSEEIPVESSINMSLNSSYNYSNINTTTVSGDDGFALTKENAENGKGTNVIINDINTTLGDWYGKTHQTSLFAEKETYYYIENDFGFVGKLEKSVIIFGDGGIYPEKVELFYSNDGYNYSFYAGEMSFDENGTFTFEFESLVYAKSVKYIIYTPLGKKTNPKAILNIGIPVAKRINLSKGLSYEVEGKTPESLPNYADTGSILTDGGFTEKTFKSGYLAAYAPTKKDTLMNRDVITVKFDLGEVKNLSEVYLYTPYHESLNVGEPEFISVKYSTDGKEFFDFSMSFNSGSFKQPSYVRNVYRAMRNHTVKARYVYVNIYSSKPVMIEEIELYGSENEVNEPEYSFPIIDDYSLLPIIRGGFYAFFIDYIQGYNYHHYYDEYRTYLQLKGFRELGMDTIIVGGENLDFESKITLIDPPAELAVKGYRKGVGHGVYDLNETILNACDKLGIKVYLSTVKSLQYPDIKGNTYQKQEYIDNVLIDGEIIIKHLYEKYSKHPSFYGFYLTDETCDWWLMQERSANTTLTRSLYKGQSDIIRTLDEKLAVAIAPAAWRSDSPKGFGESLYNLIKSDTEGTRPIVDFVFVQDCLGRFETITVPDGMYETYKGYISACKEGVEKAGAIFGNDIEIFDVTYRIKRYDEIVKSLEAEYSYTEYNFVFDLSHYFSAIGRGSLNRYPFFDNDYIYFNYVKRFWQLYN